MRASFLFLLVLIFQHQVLSQDCKVLGPAEIQGTYEGDCKKGKAHGNGTAYGMAKYIGEFKKGYPDGEGTYFYQDGEIFSGEWSEGEVYGYGYKIEKGDTLSGYWKGKPVSISFMGTDKDDLKGYKIMVKDNIPAGSPVFDKTVEGGENQLTIKLSDINRSISSVSFIEISSGQPQQPQYVNPGQGSNAFGRTILQLKDVVYPFTGTLRYQVANKAANFSVPVVLKFIIIEPGNWNVSINHK